MYCQVPAEARQAGNRADSRPVLPLKDNVPTRSQPVVTIGLIVANVLVWLWELGGRGVDYHVLKDGYYPCAVQGPCHVPAPIPIHPLPWYEGAFSSMFMHASWQHIGFNMLFLWIFGNNIEDALGRGRFLLWYLAAGIAAMAAQTAVTLWFGSAQDASIPNIGASGAIAGVLGAYFVLLPRARVLTLIIIGFIFIREIPAIWFLGIWIALQLWTGGLSLVNPQSGGGTAFFAHIGGFAFGLATILLVAKRRPVAPSSRYPVY
jgi:membrane associated rhomboid family serine protease